MFNQVLKGFQQNMIAEIQRHLRDWIDMVLQDAFRSQAFLELMQSLSQIARIDMSQWPGMIGKEPGFDPYQVLGLDKTATDTEVKARFRELAKHLHPDTSHQRGTGFLLQMVRAAYEVIKRERGWK